MRTEIRVSRQSGSRASLALLVVVFFAVGAIPAGEPEPPDVLQTAKSVDAAIEAELALSKTAVAPRAGDEDFLRRVSFDLAGTPPMPRDVTLFGLDPDPKKREKLINRLLDSEDYAVNWMRYWRDVIFGPATNMRANFARPAFEQWMTEQLEANAPWDEIATALVTATGDVQEQGDAALIYAHEGDASEIASEVSRIFLGIQIQCANCHDHPSDKWTREDFHQLAAFFPRLRVQPVRDGDRPLSFEVASFNPPPRRGNTQERRPELTMQFLDKNRDGKITKEEVADTPLGRAFDQILARLDTDKDKALSLEEFKKLPQPTGPGRGRDEHYMPDLNDPGAPGKKVDPAFFLTRESLPSGERDLDRRETLARWITSPENPWFARAYVNRIWAELLGQGFSSPIDDIGPERETRFPKVLEILSEGFIASGYDVKWLYAVIANTSVYQRQVRPAEPGTPAFAAARPTRLRSDQLYSAISEVLGIADDSSSPAANRPASPFFRRATPRDAFNDLFTFDPSTPQDDLTGEVPQALFLMNSTQIHSLIQAGGQSRLNQLLTKFPDDQEAISELYLLVLSREPSGRELAICRKYIAKVNNRNEAFEDLLWSLLNSSEFLSKR